jgi:hypothetical protein
MPGKIRMEEIFRLNYSPSTGVVVYAIIAKNFVILAKFLPTRIFYFSRRPATAGTRSDATTFLEHILRGFIYILVFNS